MLDSQEHAEQIDADVLHKLVGADLGKVFSGRDAGVGKHDVEAAVAVDGVVDDGFDGAFVGGVEGVDVHFCGGVEGGYFFGVRGQVFGGDVAEVDCAGLVGGEEVGGCAADA